MSDKATLLSSKPLRTISSCTGRNTQVTIVPEPYRHINYRQLVMSPTNKPPIAQSIVAQKLPYYLTKEAIDNTNKDRREKRLDILGKEPLIQFIKDLHLFDYAEQAAVPQLSRPYVLSLHTLLLLIFSDKSYYTIAVTTESYCFFGVF